MKTIRITLVTLAAMLLLLLIPPALGNAAPEGRIRVNITQASALSKVVLNVHGAYSIDGDSSRAIPKGTSVTVSIRDGALYCEYSGKSLNMGAQFALRRHAGSGGHSNAVSFTMPSLERYFTGDMRFYAVGGNVLTVNELPLEEYLVGVLSAEMSESFPLESLKAQAVMARSYARRYIQSPTNSRYDMLNTSAHQNYKGIVLSNSKIISAVKQTESVIARHNGQLVEGFYSSSNGGQTELAENVWGNKRGYTTMKDDPYDVENTSSKVKRLKVQGKPEAGIPLETGLDKLLRTRVAEVLNSNKYKTDASTIDIVRVLDIEPHSPMHAAPSRKYTKLKLSLEVRATKQDGTRALAELAVNVGTFTELKKQFDLGHQTANAELFSVVRDGDDFTIESRRWGHGVGMSQYGSIQMAQKYGKSYEQILNFYYDNIVLNAEKLAAVNDLPTLS